MKQLQLDDKPNYEHAGPAFNWAVKANTMVAAKCLHRDKKTRGDMLLSCLSFGLTMAIGSEVYVCCTTLRSIGMFLCCQVIAANKIEVVRPPRFLYSVQAFQQLHQRVQHGENIAMVVSKVQWRFSIYGVTGQLSGDKIEGVFEKRFPKGGGGGGAGGASPADAGPGAIGAPFAPAAPGDGSEDEDVDMDGVGGAGPEAPGDESSDSEPGSSDDDMDLADVRRVLRGDLIDLDPDDDTEDEADLADAHDGFVTRHDLETVEKLLKDPRVAKAAAAHAAEGLHEAVDDAVLRLASLDEDALAAVAAAPAAGDVASPLGEVGEVHVAGPSPLGADGGADGGEDLADLAVLWQRGARARHDALHARDLVADKPLGGTIHTNIAMVVHRTVGKDHADYVYFGSAANAGKSSGQILKLKDGRFVTLFKRWHPCQDLDIKDVLFSDTGVRGNQRFPSDARAEPPAMAKEPRTAWATAQESADLALACIRCDGVAAGFDALMGNDLFKCCICNLAWHPGCADQTKAEWDDEGCWPTTWSKPPKLPQSLSERTCCLCKCMCDCDVAVANKYNHVYINIEVRLK